MADTIHLTVQEQAHQVPMTVEEARIIEAISPEASVERVEGGVRFTVTDYEGTTSEVIYDGAKGDPGPKGDPGDPGDPSKLIDDTSTTAQNRTWSAYKLNNAISDKQDAPSTAGTSGQVLSLDSNLAPVWTTPQSGGVSDVQVNGTSVVTSGVANVPMAADGVLGVAKFDGNYGIGITGAGQTYISPANSSMIKNPTGSYRGYKPIVASLQHESAFYGMAKAAGDTSQASSANAVGIYTESAKSAISQMLDAPETVSGTTPSITAKPGVRYVCGEVSTLSITAPASGCIDVTFTSGSTATVLTVSSAKTGVTAIKWANGFDPTSLEANTTYEVNILDGEFGVVGSWT